MLLERASTILQLPLPVLSAIARRADYAYKSYTVAKRRGGNRVIHHPSRKLKAVQRWMLRSVVEAWPVHHAAAAYRRGRGIRQHAERHVRGRFLLRMDFEDFFPSLTRDDIALYLTSRPPGADEWTPADRDFFLSIVCRQGSLTIGAPTSPSLANALCYDLDAQLTALAAAHDAIYSRYADDLFFSSMPPGVLGAVQNEVKRIVSDLTLPTRLAVNDGKTHHTSRKWRREVTGLILTQDEQISLGRDRKRRIRALVHQLGALNPDERASLRGLLAFARDVEPDFINRLILKYGVGQVQAAMSR